jgi:hypothetical protein
MWLFRSQMIPHNSEASSLRRYYEGALCDRWYHVKLMINAVISDFIYSRRSPRPPRESYRESLNEQCGPDRFDCALPRCSQKGQPLAAHSSNLTSLDDSGVGRVWLLIVVVPGFGCGVWFRCGRGVVRYPGLPFRHGSE